MPHGLPDATDGLTCVCRELGCGGVELCRFGDCGARGSAVRTLVRGDRIHPNDQPCMRFHVVRTGLVATCAMTPDGRRQIICLNVPGDVICAMSAKGAECWCEALTHSEICVLDFSSSAHRLGGDPGFLRALFKLAHDRLERSAVHLVLLGRLDGMERVCAFLADLARRTGRCRDGTLRVSVPMSREDIADYLGLNTDTVSRLFTRIKKAGLAKFLSVSKFEVPSLERLEDRVPIAMARQLVGVELEERELAS